MNDRRDVAERESNKAQVTKSLYASPTLKLFGSVSQLTKSGEGSGTDGGTVPTMLMKSDRLAKENIVRIGTHPTIDLRRANREARAAGRPAPHPEPPDDDNNYWADVIKDGDRYFYRAKDTTIEISEFEYGYVLANPNLYYFSQTVKVHVRLERARNGEEARIQVSDFMLGIHNS